MLPSQFCTFWASLNSEFAASEDSLALFKVGCSASACALRICVCVTMRSNDSLLPFTYLLLLIAGMVSGHGSQRYHALAPPLCTFASESCRSTRSLEPSCTHHSHTSAAFFESTRLTGTRSQSAKPSLTCILIPMLRVCVVAGAWHPHLWSKLVCPYAQNKVRQMLLNASTVVCMCPHSAVNLQATAGQFGLEALYLARAIPDACPLRDKWIKACVPLATAGHSLGSLLAASIHVPSPLKLNIMPAEFDRIWFPGCAVPEVAAEDETPSPDGDVVDDYRSEIWGKFMLGRDVPVLSALLAEGMP